MEINTDTLKIKPYARLLTMLGDQLIKNERVALGELVKNSYDADADWVLIKFDDFGDIFQIKENSKIIIEDNGEGMTAETIIKGWMNPATPNKFQKDEPKITKVKKRIIQGEKGIGRFSALKLGKNIKIITRPKDFDKEYVINFDFSKYDDDFTTEDGVDKELFLDDINISVITRDPIEITDKPINFGKKTKIRENHGTRIEISDLKGSWTEYKLSKVFDDLSKLSLVFSNIFLTKIKITMNST